MMGRRAAQILILAAAAVAAVVIYWRVSYGRYFGSLSGRLALEAAATAALRPLAPQLAVRLEQPRTSGFLNLTLTLPRVQVLTAGDLEPAVDGRNATVQLQWFPYVFIGQAKVVGQLKDQSSAAVLRLGAVTAIADLLAGALTSGSVDIAIERLPLATLFRLLPERRLPLPTGLKPAQFAGVVGGATVLTLANRQLEPGEVLLTVSGSSVNGPPLKAPLHFAATQARVIWRAGAWGLATPMPLIDRSAGVTITATKPLGAGTPFSLTFAAPPAWLGALAAGMHCRSDGALKIRLERDQWAC